MGDLILTLPVFTEIRRRWPRAHVCHAGYLPQARLVTAAGLADSFFPLDSAVAAEWFGPLPEGVCWRNEWLDSFDLAITFIPDGDGCFHAHLSAAGVRRILRRSPHVTEGHAADHFAKVLEGDDVGRTPRLPMPPGVVEAGRRRAEESGGRLVALHPGSGSPAKNWPLARFVELAGLIRARGIGRPVFLAGEAESALLPALRSLAPEVVVVTGLDILELAGFLGACQAYVGNDSGVTHLAAATGIPVVALFGPTDPAIWGPRGGNVRIVAQLDILTGTPGMGAAGVADILPRFRDL